MELIKVKERLSMLGYTLQETDDTHISYALAKAEDYIFNFCNISSIPRGLEMALVDLACSFFLSEKFYLRQLPEEYISSAVPVKSIKELDTSVEFAIDTNISASQGFNRLLSSLQPEKSALIRFRRIPWKV